jgi:hypothetical protein
MEKTLTIIKGGVHQKSMDQTGNVIKGAGLVKRIVAQGATK